MRIRQPAPGRDRSQRDDHRLIWQVEGDANQDKDHPGEGRFGAAEVKPPQTAKKGGQQSYRDCNDSRVNDRALHRDQEIPATEQRALIILKLRLEREGYIGPLLDLW